MVRSAETLRQQRKAVATTMVDDAGGWWRRKKMSHDFQSTTQNINTSGGQGRKRREEIEASSSQGREGLEEEDVSDGRGRKRPEEEDASGGRGRSSPPDPREWGWAGRALQRRRAPVFRERGWAGCAPQRKSARISTSTSIALWPGMPGHNAMLVQVDMLLSLPGATRRSPSGSAEGVTPSAGVQGQRPCSYSSLRFSFLRSSFSSQSPSFSAFFCSRSRFCQLGRPQPCAE